MAVTAINEEKTMEGDRERKTMKAIAHTQYGRPEPGVLDLVEVDVPVPEDDQVLVRVYASSVNPVEWYGVTGPYFARVGAGFRKPKDPEWEPISPEWSKRSAVRSRTLGRVTRSLVLDLGAYAEYTIARTTRVALKPTNVSFEEAADRADRGAHRSSGAARSRAGSSRRRRS